jgi:hypothetical protein
MYLVKLFLSCFRLGRKSKPIDSLHEFYQRKLEYYELGPVKDFQRFTSH